MRAYLPHLRRSDQAHVLTLSPPLNLAPHWLGRHPGYTLTKYGMTLLTMGWAAEYADAGIAANCLWPKTTIATAGVINLFGEQAARSRNPVRKDAHVGASSEQGDDPAVPGAQL